eukprot:TRINITY_DN2846_c0_g1_i1.p1 TRINITY_DN2846_c0_g1~~TRINITY_DN2846_c0_g1_i1.p1  ORF type:complete len:369 (-),score=119.45 TRINITY_DN2846_c0_g1_i1:98-1204(-)
MADKKAPKLERLPNADNKTGGWKLTDQSQIVNQKNVAMDIIKQIGQNLVNKKDLVSVTMPINICEPRSYLQRIADGWCHAPNFLTKAAKTSDPVERLKLVVTFVISGLHNTCSQKKPLNPILGETYECVFEDGTTCYMEQSSHHPPISSWQVFGPDNCYSFYGWGQWCAFFRGNCVKGHQKGPLFIEFPDGTKIEFNLPEVWVKGVLYGERIIEYEGEVSFKDEKNNLLAEVTISPPGSSGFISRLCGYSDKPLSDYMLGDIYKISKGDDDGQDQIHKASFCKITGSWLGCILFDDVSYWDFRDNLKLHTTIPKENPLPSDARFREDLIHLAKGDEKGAQEMKTKLENKQRRDAKLRKEKGKEREGKK